MKPFNQTPILILAAGLSSRAGMHKGLIPFQHTTWLEYQIQKLKMMELHNISIVVSPETHKAYLPMIEKYNLKGILNPNPNSEKFDSVFIGFSNIDEASVFLLPIDVPVADESVWQKLLDCFDESECEVRVPVFDNQGGHPVLLKQNFIKKVILDQKQTYQRLDHWIQNSKVERVIVTDPSVIRNMNHLSDYQS